VEVACLPNFYGHSCVYLKVNLGYLQLRKECIGKLVMFTDFIECYTITIPDYYDRTLYFFYQTD